LIDQIDAASLAGILKVTRVVGKKEFKGLPWVVDHRSKHAVNQAEGPLCLLKMLLKWEFPKWTIIEKLKLPKAIEVGPMFA
jgi:hypothetical protein